jgi:hypothetical protein
LRRYGGACNRNSVRSQLAVDLLQPKKIVIGKLP